MTTSALAALVRAQRAELGLSLRQAAEKSGGLVGPSTLNAIERGEPRRVTDRIITGIATALELPESKVRRAAGLAAQAMPPFVLPARAQRLTARERRLVLNLVDTLLAAHQKEK